MARQAGSAGSAASARPTRRRVDPERKRLGLAVLMVIFGSFAPWVDTAVGAVSGARGPGLWTFYASMLGMAGALIPSRRVAGVQAAVMALVCTALPVWQLARAASMLGFGGGWLPGPGLVLVFGGGVLAGACAYGLVRRAAQEAAVE